MTNEIKIGNRIRELRQKKGLTQKELAGEHITRNMLSLIESGTASPSLTTLCYLSEKLEVPIGYFFTHTPEEERSYHKAAAIDLLKKAYVDKDYEKCTELCSELPIAYVDDEIAMIAAVSYLRLATQSAGQYAINRASSFLTKANDFSHRTAYLDHSFHQATEYYAKLFKSLHSAEIPSILTDLSYASVYVPFEMILYFGVIRSAKDIKNKKYPFPSGTLYEKHIEAIRLMNEGAWPSALPLLKMLAKDSTLPYFMQYRVLCDLEIVSNNTGDLRGAYVSARKKLALLEAVNN